MFDEIQNMGNWSFIISFDFIQIEYQCNWTHVLRNEC